MTSDSHRHELLYSIVSRIALVASITVFITFLYRVAQHGMPRRATSGIPVERPDEARRILHPAGFSIVRPEFWGSEIVSDRDHPDEGGIKLWSPVHVKPGSSLDVAKLASAPTLRGQVQEIRFQDRPARMTMTYRTPEDLEQPGQLTVELAFARDNAHWLFRYDLDHNQPTIPQRMWEYMETFSSRIPSKRESGDGGEQVPPKVDAF